MNRLTFLALIALLLAPLAALTTKFNELTKEGTGHENK